MSTYFFATMIPELTNFSDPSIATGFDVFNIVAWPFLSITLARLARSFAPTITTCPLLLFLFVTLLLLVLLLLGGIIVGWLFAFKGTGIN